MRKDNSTLREKAALRRVYLGYVGDPVVMETHGGNGQLFPACYRHVRRGITFDTDVRKAECLAAQRPTWSVYHGDCVKSIERGAGAHLPVNFLDVDPYGDPWPAIAAFLGSDRPRPDALVVVVNDGLRLKCRIGGSWLVHSLKPAVEVFGNDLAPRYLEVCRYLVDKLAREHGYSATRFHGYHCGQDDYMTHFGVVMKR